MNSPRVSIIMPVFNCQDYIEESISSLLSQTYKDFELLVLDDCSWDDTLKIIRRIKDSRLKVIKNQKNIGVTKSLNKLLKLVKGDLIARADGDDVYNSKRLELQINFLDKRPDYVMVGSNAILIDNQNKPLSKKKYPQTDYEIRKQFYIPTPLLHPTVMMRGWVFNKIGYYNESLNGAEDYDLFFRIASLGKLYNLPQYLIKRRMHPEGVSLKKPLNREFKALMVRLIHLPEMISMRYLKN